MMYVQGRISRWLSSNLTKFKIWHHKRGGCAYSIILTTQLKANHIHVMHWQRGFTVKEKIWQFLKSQTDIVRSALAYLLCVSGSNVAIVDYSSGSEKWSAGSVQVSAVARELRTSFATLFCNSKRPQNNTAKLNPLVPNGNLSTKQG